VALGIFYLHSCKPPVLHLDLKSANVLLDDSGKAKVCDFGLAHLKLGSGVQTHRMGSPMWTAPEVKWLHPPHAPPAPFPASAVT
ncbi:MAG: hypothetical protein SGPRY_008248, partial [Prymnesium sp.]